MPVLADSIWVDAWPTANDRPAKNLYTGDDFADGGLARIAIPRHGSRPRTIPKNFSPTQTLPGAVNVVFADNHAQTIPLEDLWKLEWHKDYVVPAQRPR